MRRSATYRPFTTPNSPATATRSNRGPGSSGPLPRRVWLTGGSARRAAQLRQVRHDTIQRRHPEREVAFVGIEMGLRERDMGGEPLAVRKGDHPVLSTLPHRHRASNAVEVEAPIPRKGQVIIPPARNSG